MSHAAHELVEDISPYLPISPLYLACISQVSHAAHELVEGVEHMIEEEHELDRVALQEARERAEAEKAGQRATGRVGWGDLRGDLGKRSSGEEAAEERRTSGRSSGDEVKAPRRRVGRGAMTASLMKKRPSKAETADYNPNLTLTLTLTLTLMLTLTITLTLTLSLTPTLTLTIEGGVGEAMHWRWSCHREG